MSGIPNADWTIKLTPSEEVTPGKIQPAHSFVSITFSSPSFWVQFYATFFTVNDLPQEMKLPNNHVQLVNKLYIIPRLKSTKFSAKHCQAQILPP